MRKIVSIILVLGIMWLVKLSYDVWQISRTVPQLEQSLLQSEQHYANLNDQLVALQRQQHSPTTTNSTAATLAIAPIGISPTVVIKQELDLIQFAIDQQQFIYAVDHLNRLQQALVHYEIAPALQQSLTQAMEQDKQAIQHYVLGKDQQQQLLDDLLRRVDQNVQQTLQQPRLEMDQSDTLSWWEKWFRVEKIQTPSVDLMNRSVVYKEVQLRLLIAEQALNQGKRTEYQNELQSIIQKLNEMPDATSQQLKKQIEKVARLPSIPVPKLTTLGLLG